MQRQQSYWKLYMTPLVSSDIFPVTSQRSQFLMRMWASNYALTSRAISRGTLIETCSTACRWHAWFTTLLWCHRSSASKYLSVWNSPLAVSYKVQPRSAYVSLETSSFKVHFKSRCRSRRKIFWIRAKNHGVFKCQIKQRTYGHSYSLNKS